MLRLLHSSRLDALVRQRLDDVTELITELEGPAGAAGGHADAAAADANTEIAKQLAAGLKNAYKLQVGALGSRATRGAEVVLYRSHAALPECGWMW